MKHLIIPNLGDYRSFGTPLNSEAHGILETLVEEIGKIGAKDVDFMYPDMRLPREVAQFMRSRIPEGYMFEGGETLRDLFEDYEPLSWKIDKIMVVIESTGSEVLTFIGHPALVTDIPKYLHSRGRIDSVNTTSVPVGDAAHIDFDRRSHSSMGKFMNWTMYEMG